MITLVKSGATSDIGKNRTQTQKKAGLRNNAWRKLSDEKSENFRASSYSVTPSPHANTSVTLRTCGIVCVKPLLFEY